MTVHPALLMPYRCRRACGVIMLFGALALPSAALARQAGPSTAAADPGAVVDDEHADDAHESGWLMTAGRVVNFAILAGVIIYFARMPIARYLTGRGETIRRDLVDADTLRQSAESQLQGVRSRLAELPAELAALEARGREELEQERIRMRETTAREREKMLDDTHREVTMQQRLAKRQLVEHTANLAMNLARTRIAAAITDEDQGRLLDRYASEVRS